MCFCRRLSQALIVSLVAATASSYPLQFNVGYQIISSTAKVLREDRLLDLMLRGFIIGLTCTPKKIIEGKTNYDIHIHGVAGFGGGVTVHKGFKKFVRY